MSERENSLEDTQLPTPASTPLPLEDLDKFETEDQPGSSGSSVSAPSDHTTVPNASNSTLVMASNELIDTDTPAQRQSIKMTSILHKIAISTKLSSSNYVAWSDGIRFGLMAASYDHYLDSEEAGAQGINPDIHSATKKAIFYWLLSSIDLTQSTRFISMISKFENGIKTTDPSPSLLWKTIRDYHISNSESVKLMLRSEITDLSQGTTKDLLDYIDIFRAKVDAYLGSNGEMSEEEQARQFVRSLNRDWAEKGCDLLDAGHVKFKNLETELKKTYQTRKMFSSSRQQSSRIAETSDSSQGNRIVRTSVLAAIILPNLMIRPIVFITLTTRLRWKAGNAQNEMLANGSITLEVDAVTDVEVFEGVNEEEAVVKATVKLI
ncbi:uncharacterized protein MELLADRAFT_112708 [Melampsora larici-populina 98AG31]|uniref:Uncharacterized protein n=1 Tax=Melampsora larici-populina (strain 98AG31 / pathotype 3-4-7) TaxID=747676 RepID=F4S7C1_MELLP|nr:uncharacterized protein MELLADRAFT_112708 [Melampsora larici-populina 98AG31]EGF99495.1 hypothetical protein MELLADRAFT_112708 [Melampsora larici-populina 98AG31]